MAENHGHAYFKLLRQSAREAVMISLESRSSALGLASAWEGLVFQEIDLAAIHDARTVWPLHYGRGTHFGFQLSWEKLFYRYSPRPAHFNLAIWQRSEQGRVLLALALGMTDRRKGWLRLDYVERTFAPEAGHLRLLLPVLAVAEAYARLLDCQRMLIRDPVEPSQFARYGFSEYTKDKSGHSYLAREL